MADIKLTRPAAGQNVVAPSAPDARMVLDFAADQVSIDRPQGSDSLYFRFDDGSSIELQNFYTQYNKDAIPSFEVDGQLIAGADFFNAFGPDLAPAAGPAAGPTRSGRYSDFGNSNLADGVNHLDGLDYRLSFAGDTQPNLDPYPLITNSAPTLSTGGATISMGITEAGVGKPHMAPITGSFTVNDPDGDSISATVNFGGSSVAINGVTTLSNNFGTLIITPSGGGSNVTYQFSYEVNDNPVDPLFRPGDLRTDGADSLAQGETHTEVITITISDGMGHTVTQPINITITGTNDAPDIRSFDDLTLKDDGRFGGTDEYTDKDTGNTINPAENNKTAEGAISTDDKVDGTHHLLHAVGTITAFDPDHNVVLTYGISSSGLLKDAGGQENNASYKVEGYTPPADQTLQPTIQGCDTQIKTDYGTLYLNSSTGKYEFVVNPESDATNHLAEGQTVTLSFSPTVTDEHGATDAEFGVMRNSGTPGGGSNGINITIMGSNDVPVIQSANWGESGNTVTEASLSYVGGTVVATDVDAIVPTGDHISESDTLRYGLFHPASQGSESGTMVQDLYVVPTASDSDGTLHYTLSNTQPDNGNFYGTVHIDKSSGSYSFTLNNGAACVDALDDDSDKGSSLEVTFPVVVEDQFGAFAKQDVKLTIKGVNDAPVFSKTSNGHDVKESGVYSNAHEIGKVNTLYAEENTTKTRDSNGEGGDYPNGLTDGVHHELVATGTVVATDVDNGDANHLTYSLVNEAGGKTGSSTMYVTATYHHDSVDANGSHWTPVYSTTDTSGAINYLGKLVMREDGNYTFTLSDTGVANTIAEDDNIKLTFTPAVYDSSSYNTTKGPDITVTVHGSNEAPIFDAVKAVKWDTNTPKDGLSGVITESATSLNLATISGSVAASDVDHGDTLTYSFMSGTASVSLLYVVPANNAAGYELKVLPTDVDGNSTENYFGTISMTDAQNGNFTFTLKNDAACVQALDDDNVGVTGFKISVPAVAQDSHGAWAKTDVLVTINGTNDAPVIDGVVDLEVAETGVRADAAHPMEGGNAVFSGKNVSGEGHISANDADAHDKLTYLVISADGTGAVGGMIAVADIKTDAHYSDAAKAIVVNGNSYNAAYRVASGTLYLNTATGKYVFELNDAVAEHLPQDAKQAVSFSIRVSDGDAADVKDHAINVSITGTNDRPTLGFVDAKGKSVAGGDLSVTEKGYNVTGKAGASGYVLGDDHDDGAVLHFGLVAGNVTAGDEFGKLGAAFNADAEGTAGMGDGVTTVTGVYGKLTITAAGKYTYSLNNSSNSAADKLGLKADGTPETAQDDFTVYVRDEHGAWSTQHIAVTVTGSNDAPVLSAVNRSVVESGVKDGGNQITWGTPSVSGTLAVTDVDVIDQGTKQTFAVKGVKADGTSVTPTVASGSFTVETGTYDARYTVDSGVLYLNTATGAYAFVLTNNADSVNGLDLGDKLSIKFSVTVADVHGVVSAPKDITVTITGTNDKPSLTLGYEKGITHETQSAAGATPAYEQIHVADSNNDAFGHVSGSLTTALGTAASADDDASAKAYFGAVKGLVAEGPSSLLAAKIAGTSFNAVDKTDKASATSEVTVQGLHGTLHVYANGKYFYEMDAQQADKGGAINQLKDGDHFDDTFTILVKDEHGAWTTRPITVRIDGVNDTPYRVSDNELIVNVKESGHGYSSTSGGVTAYHGNKEVSGSPVVDGKIYFNDDTAAPNAIHIKDDDSTALSTTNPFAINSSKASASGEGSYTLTTDYGTFTLNKDGTYKFELDNTLPKVKELNQGEGYYDLKVPIIVQDADGGKLQFYITVKVTGTNDTPTIFSYSNAMEITDARGVAPTISGSVAKVTDDDNDGSKSEIFTYGITNSAMPSDGGASGVTPGMGSSMAGSYGTLVIDPSSGKYTYTLDNNNAAVKALSGKDHLTETFHVMVRDAAGAFDIKPVTVTINGTADPMKLANLDAQVLQVREDGVAFNTNTADAGTLTANGELVVQVADNPVGNDGANHLHYGFVDASSKVLAVGKAAAGVIEYKTAYGTLKITQVDNAGGTGDQKVHFEFVLDSAKAEGLNANQQALLSGIKLAVWDDRVSKEPVVEETNNPAVAQKLDVYINGTNDKPYFTGIETGEGHNKGNIISENALSEDAVKGASITGKFVADDPDAGHTPTDLSYGIVVGDKLVQAAEGKYGILELRPNGSYTYTLTKPLPAEFQTLDNGKLLSATDMALLQENFTVRVTDPLNAYTQTTLVIDCKGATDAPSFAVTHIGITEDNGFPVRPATQVASDNPVTKGTLALNTTDAADTTNYTGGKWSITGATKNTDGSYTYEGKYATFVLESNGSYTYTLHGNDTAEVQAFSQGSSIAEKISVTVTGKDGTYRTETVTLTVNGANDAPVFGKDAYEGEVKYGVYEKEGNWGDVAPNPTGVVFTGTVAATDVDAGNKLTYALMDGTGHKVTELATEYGVITINPSTGAYTYYLNDRGLKNGSEDKINVIVTDEHGATDTAAINIDIAAASGGGSGGWPRFLDMDGTTLRPNAIQEDNGTVAHPQDNPYGGSITATGQLDARYALDLWDLGKAPDHGFGVSNNGEQVQGMQGQYGFITVNPATGAYVYTLYNSSDKVQALKAGQTVTDEFYVMLDGNLQNEYGVLGNDAKIVITIKGTNDRPLVKGYDDLSIEERARTGFEDDNKAALTASGTITAKDVDGDAVTFTVKIQPAHGTVSLDPKTGEYTYTVNENLGHLKAGEVKPDSFTVEASDGHGGVTTQVIPITINGVNWAPKVVTTNPKLTVVEDADITKGATGVVTGDLSDLISDDEGLGNLSFTLESAGTGAKGSMLVQGKYGTLHITPSGQYVYTVNNGSDAVQGLDSKHPGTETFTITAKDQHGASVPITLEVAVTGKDDAPQLTVDKVLTVTEGVEGVASGQATAYDKDIADQTLGALKFSLTGGRDGVDDDGKTCQSYTNDYGTFRVYENGAYTFDLNNASNDVKALKAGELKETSATLVVTDLNGNETTQNITVNIKGTASVPEVTTVIGDKNPDLASDHGDYGYDIEAVANAGTGQSYTAQGQIDGMDYEAGKAPVFTVQTQGSYGTLTIKAEGKYTYTADAAKVEALGDGVPIKDSVTILLTAANGLTSKKTLVIDILGANDTPTITSTGWTGSGELTEQGYLNPAQADSISGTVVGHDVDTSDNGHLSYGFVGSSSVVSTLYAVPDDASFKLVEGEPADHNYFGTFTMNAGTGAYTFTLNNAATCVQQMGGSDAIHISANVAVKDPHGLVATQTIGLDIHGSNDAPTVTSAVWQGGNELTEAGYDNLAAVAAITGTVAGQDVDASDAAHLSYGFVLTLAGVQTVAQTLYAVPDGASFSLVDAIPADHNYYGTFTMNGGEYTFTLNNDADCVQHLNVADTLHLGAQVVAVDQGHVVSEPVDISLTIHGSNDAPVVHVDGFNIYATDVDSSLSFNVQDDALYGHITQQTDGSYAYTLNVDDATALNILSAADVAGGIITDGADYSVSDEHTSASGAVSVGVSVDNWDGHGGHLLFSAPDANGHYTAQAASGHNVILGGDNDDILYGGTGDDILYGGAGHNELHGGDGNDHLYGGTSYGGTSNDFLDGGKGSNVLDGGAGNDVLVFHQGDHIDGGVNTDMLLVSGTDTTSVDDLFNSKTSNIEVIVKGSAVDSLTDMKALADKGISFNEHNQVELDAGKGWQDTHTSVDGHDVWTNTAGDLTVTIKHDDAENAKNVIVATHNS